MWDASPNGFLNSRDVIDGIEAASALGPGIIKLSFGGQNKARIEEEAILRAVARGAVVVAAAGNDGARGSPRSFPADLPHVLTVASTESTGSVSSFSTRGLGTDVAAPGEALPVAVPASFAPSGFTSVTGTSFAARS